MEPLDQRQCFKIKRANLVDALDAFGGFDRPH